MHLFDENVKVSDAIAVTNTYRTAGAVTGAVVDMAKHGNLACVIKVTGATQWQGALTCNIAEGTNTTQFSTTYLATVTLASGTTNQIEVLEVDARKMTDGYRYLRLRVAPAAGTGNMFAADNYAFNPRFGAVSN